MAPIKLWKKLEQLEKEVLSCLICSNNVEGSLVRFKDHKRSTYMIASALNGDDTLTTTIVPHKLKQLGLHVP